MLVKGGKLVLQADTEQCGELVLLQHKDVARMHVFTQKTAGQRLVHMATTAKSYRDKCFPARRKNKNKTVGMYQ